MKLETKYLGELDINEKELILFPKGLPGFPDETDFIILDFPGNNAFWLLQSVQTAELAFVVTNPYLFYEDYTQKLDDKIVESLQIQKPEDVIIYSIVTVKQPFIDSTMNLRAPIIINSQNRQGKQYISNDNTYSSQAPLAPEEKGEK